MTDLQIRATVAQRSLEGVPDFTARRADVIASVSYIAKEAAHLLSEDLDGDSSTFYPTYQKLTRLMYERETFELPFVLHFDTGSQRATRLCEALLDNIEWPYEPMVVGTLSSQYYWTNPYWRIIAVPSNEESRLLAIGDLCHELGHTVYAQKDREMVDDFPIALGSHLREQVGSDAIPEGVDPSDYLTEVFYSWQQSWLQEFVCDLIATYLVGPAFLRQHVRLRAMAQPYAPIFNVKYGSSHPADHARARACMAQLRKLGFEQETNQLDEIWSELVASSGEAKSALYDVIYPEALLDLLAETVVDGCVAVGLRTYDPDADASADIPRLANEAWMKLETAPEDYQAWEADTLAELWRGWGV